MLMVRDPANHKWSRNLAVSQIVAETMHDLRMTNPAPAVDLADIRRKYHAQKRREGTAGHASRYQVRITSFFLFK